jgi:hypothetical protein
LHFATKPGAYDQAVLAFMKKHWRTFAKADTLAYGHFSDFALALRDVRFLGDCVAKLPLRRLAIHDSVGWRGISGGSA